MHKGVPKDQKVVNPLCFLDIVVLLSIKTRFAEQNDLGSQSPISGHLKAGTFGKSAQKQRPLFLRAVRLDI